MMVMCFINNNTTPRYNVLQSQCRLTQANCQTRPDLILLSAQLPLSSTELHSFISHFCPAFHVGEALGGLCSLVWLDWRGYTENCIYQTGRWTEPGVIIPC